MPTQAAIEHLELAGPNTPKNDLADSHHPHAVTRLFSGSLLTFASVMQTT